MSSQLRTPRFNGADATVSRLELFFDLVFVYAITQVTLLMAEDLGPGSLLRGLLLLGLLWASWAGYAWLCNNVTPETVRTMLLTAMTAMLGLALFIPEAFDDAEGGLPGPLMVAVCYLLFRLIHLAAYWLVSRDDPRQRRRLAGYAPFVLAGTALLFAASATHGGVQLGLWVAALGMDYLGILAGGSNGWHLRSAGHFAERHGLIMIVALGESIVAIGMSVRHHVVDGPALLGAALGLAVTTSLWWIYFGTDAGRAEHALQEAPARDQTLVARDVYSLLHLPLLLGVVMTALGEKQVLEDVGSPLASPASLALHGGVVVFLLGQAALRWRTGQEQSRARWATAVGVVLAAALSPLLPALTSLAALAALLLALVAHESVVRGGDRVDGRAALAR